jgi:hypothetical protein
MENSVQSYGRYTGRNKTYPNVSYGVLRSPFWHHGEDPTIALRMFAASKSRPVTLTFDDSTVSFLLFSFLESAPLYPRTYAAAVIGSVKVNVEPLPASLSTQIFPPCSSTNFFASVKPSPVPSTL